MNLKYAVQPPEWLLGLTGYWAIFLVVLWFIFSCTVWNDAAALEKKGFELRFLSPFWWFLFVLAFSIPAAALYWVANRSTLSNLERRD